MSFVNTYYNFLIYECYIDYDYIHILSSSLVTLHKHVIISVELIYVLWLPYCGFQGTHVLLFHKNLCHDRPRNKFSQLDGLLSHILSCRI